MGEKTHLILKACFSYSKTLKFLGGSWQNKIGPLHLKIRKCNCYLACYMSRLPCNLQPCFTCNLQQVTPSCKVNCCPVIVYSRHHYGLEHNGSRDDVCCRKSVKEIVIVGTLEIGRGAENSFTVRIKPSCQCSQAEDREPKELLFGRAHDCTGRRKRDPNHTESSLTALPWPSLTQWQPALRQGL